MSRYQPSRQRCPALCVCGGGNAIGHQPPIEPNIVAAPTRRRLLHECSPNPFLVIRPLTIPFWCGARSPYAAWAPWELRGHLILFRHCSPAAVSLRRPPRGDDLIRGSGGGSAVWSNLKVKVPAPAVAERTSTMRSPNCRASGIMARTTSQPSQPARVSKPEENLAAAAGEQRVDLGRGFSRQAIST